MRVAMMAALLVLAGCASEKLALAPPPGVDFSGKWQLNEADSDDPQRLAQVDPSKVSGQGAPGGGQGGGGQGGGGRGGRGRGGGGFGGPGAAAAGPVMPGMGAVGAGLRWPGKALEIKQTGGIVSMASGGANRVFTPSALDKKPQEHKKPRDDVHRPEDDDMPARRGRGEGRPQLCGWDDKTLVVQANEPDDDHPPFEQRYSLSEDGQRLIEVIGFNSGRSAGFTLSRVWDRVVPGSAPANPTTSAATSGGAPSAASAPMNSAPPAQPPLP